MRQLHRGLLGGMMKLIVGIALTLALLAPLGAPAFAAEPDQPESLITPAEAIRMAVQNRLSAKFTATSDRKKDEQGALVEFYSVADQKPLWVDANGFTARGKGVMAEIAAADDYGLRSSDYVLPKQDGFSASDPRAIDWLADAEITVSYAVLDYATDARGGRIKPQRLSENLDPSLALPNPTEVIESIAIRSDAAAYLRSFQPDQPQFEALRQKLIALRGGKAEPAAVEKPANFIPDGQVLKIGVVDPQVALLRKRLDVAANPGADKNAYDMGLALAVQRFQQAHGAYGDGAVGPGTRRMLNGQSDAAPRETGGFAKIRAILINMERWRWLPHDLGSYYVTVNIPEFMLRVVDDGKPVHSTRVVVGKIDKQTPVFSNEMQEIVFGPFWNVPTSIKIEEIRPYVRQEASWFGGGGYNTAVFQRHNLRIKYAGREVDPPRSIGTPPTSAASISTSRRDPTTCSARSNSCFPTSMTSTCTTRRRNSCSPSPCGPRATAACACRTPTSWPRSCSSTRTAGATPEPPQPSRTATILMLRCNRRSPSTSPTSPLR